MFPSHCSLRFTDPASRIAEPGPCNIEVRDHTLTQEEFLERLASTCRHFWISVPELAHATKQFYNMICLCYNYAIILLVACDFVLL